jgi:hypothetical protein
MDWVSTLTMMTLSCCLRCVEVASILLAAKPIIPAVNSRVGECREGVCTPPLGPAGSHPGLKAEVSLASMNPKSRGELILRSGFLVECLRLRDRRCSGRRWRRGVEVST